MTLKRFFGILFWTLTISVYALLGATSLVSDEAIGDYPATAVRALNTTEGPNALQRFQITRWEWASEVAAKEFRQLEDLCGVLLMAGLVGIVIHAWPTMIGVWRYHRARCSE